MRISRDRQEAHHSQPIPTDTPARAEIRKTTGTFVRYRADITTVWRPTVISAGRDTRSPIVSAQNSSIATATDERRPCLPTAEQIVRSFGLTPKEAQVATLLADRQSNREIAAELGVTEHTARRHTEKVLRKLDVHRRALVKRALLAA